MRVHTRKLRAALVAALVGAGLAIGPTLVPQIAHADAYCSAGGSALASKGVNVPNYGQIGAITVCGWTQANGHGVLINYRYAQWHNSGNYPGGATLFIIGGGTGAQKDITLASNDWTGEIAATNLTAYARIEFIAAGQFFDVRTNYA